MNTSFLIRKRELLDQSLNIQLYTKQKKECLLWGAVNAVILAVLWVRLTFTGDETSWWTYVERLVAAIAGLKLACNVIRYLYYSILVQPVRGTEDQKRYMNFVGNEFQVSPPRVTEHTTRTVDSPDSINVSALSWQSFGSDAAVSSSWVYNRDVVDQREPVLQRTKYADDSITDEKSLKDYLKQVNESEENASMVKLNESSLQNSALSFWNNRLDDVSSLLKTSLYQLSPLSSAKPKDDLGSMFGDLDTGNSEELRKISSVKLAAYVTNLRMWMAETILHRVVKEIGNIDETLRSRGFSEIQIGSVGLERLKKTTENRQLVLHVPSFPMLVPFLDMSTNQEYLVQRIKGLAQGKCMAEYRWNSGSDYNDVTWNDHLPTDAAIVFHVFCTYLDSQLMPLPDRNRPFTSRYVIINDTKKPQTEIVNEVKNRLKCAILCTNTLKPKFNFISDGKIHNCAHDRNNLFYVIIQFLIYMKTHNDGSLEGVSLGKRGINMLCCIEESSQ